MRNTSSEAGFSLVEVITATVIAVIAVVGLAYSFSAGRGMVDRYATARAALAAAEQTMERLSMLGQKDPLNPDLAETLPPKPPHSSAITLNGNPTGMVQWTVEWKDDPADGIYPQDPNKRDYIEVIVKVTWMSGTVQDHVELNRILLGS